MDDFHWPLEVRLHPMTERRAIRRTKIKKYEIPVFRKRFAFLKKFEKSYLEEHRLCYSILRNTQSLFHELQSKRQIFYLF